MRLTTAISALMLAVAPAALANDGFGGLTATGLQFSETTDVQMLSEDLYLSLDTIKVAYVFRHGGDEDVTGEVIFPLPPINLAAISESEFAIDTADLDKENIVGFTAKVDGKAIAVSTDRIAVKDPAYDESRKASANYETPGEDITALLKSMGIPLSLNIDLVSAKLKALPQAAKDTLTAKELAFFGEDGEAMAMWSIIERYHWTQTFAHGKDVKIEHSYRSAPPGGIFVWNAPKAREPGDYQETLIKKYCIDAGTQSAIQKALTPSDDGLYSSGIAYYLDYVLTTANTWAGPIGTFKLTIDKGDAKNVLSLCIDGIKKTGPTTFVVEKKDFTPQRDLNLLIVKRP
jgi:hypothetical protein